jgi:hypothetical protein
MTHLTRNGISAQAAPASDMALLGLDADAAGSGAPPRSARAEVRNPLLACVSASAVLALPAASRSEIGYRLLQLGRDAARRAEQHWQANQRDEAHFWRVFSVYVKHLDHLIDPPAARRGRRSAEAGWGTDAATALRLRDKSLADRRVRQRLGVQPALQLDVVLWMAALPYDLRRPIGILLMEYADRSKACSYTNWYGGKGAMGVYWWNVARHTASLGRLLAARSADLDAAALSMTGT